MLNTHVDEPDVRGWRGRCKRDEKGRAEGRGGEARVCSRGELRGWQVGGCCKGEESGKLALGREVRGWRGCARRI